MGEFVSDDVLDWARDLAALQMLLAGGSLEHPVDPGSATILSFAEGRASGSDPPLPTSLPSPSIKQAASV
jgi:hypothetical protein